MYKVRVGEYKRLGGKTFDTLRWRLENVLTLRLWHRLFPLESDAARVAVGVARAVFRIVD